jgi:hypothetical protein
MEWAQRPRFARLVFVRAALAPGPKSRAAEKNIAAATNAQEDACGTAGASGSIAAPVGEREASRGGSERSTPHPIVGVLRSRPTGATSTAAGREEKL